MTRQEKMNQIRKRLSELTEDQKQALISKVGIVTIEGRTLSIHNNMMIAIQNPNATIVGGYKQWIRAGKHVKTGEHGVLILFPVGNKEKDSEGNETITEIDRYYAGTVFDITQVES